MSTDSSIPLDEEIRFLPQTPVVYLSMMRAKEGKPIGTPIWSSFDDRSSERTMENESMASTFLSLSNSISDMANDSEGDGKILRLNVNRMTYNIFLPHPSDDFQLCFVIVFEKKEDILVRDEYKTELVKIVTETLRSHDEFRAFLDDESNIRLNKGDKLYDDLFYRIKQNIVKWDKQRVKYLEKKREERRKEEELLKQQLEDEESEEAED